MRDRRNGGGRSGTLSCRLILLKLAIPRGTKSSMDPKAVLNSSGPRHGALITRQAVLWRGLPNSASDAFYRRFWSMYVLEARACRCRQSGASEKMGTEPTIAKNRHDGDVQHPIWQPVPEPGPGRRTEEIFT